MQNGKQLAIWSMVTVSISDSVSSTVVRAAYICALTTGFLPRVLLLQANMSKCRLYAPDPKGRKHVQ